MTTTTPFIDSQAQDVAHLILQDAAYENPVAGVLSPAVSDYETVKNLTTGSGNISSSSITTAVANVTSTPTDGTFTPAIKATMLSDLGTLQTSMSPFQSTAQGAFDNAAGLLQHTDDMTTGILGVDGSIASITDLPNQLISDIPGGLPTSFPGIPNLSAIPSFDGLASIPAIPSLGLPSLPSISSVTNFANLPGINLPGVPDLSNVLSGGASSILDSSFGGIGGALSGNAASIATGALAGMNPLSGSMGSVLAAGTNPAALAAAAGGLTTSVASFTPGLDSLAPGFGDMGGGMGDLVGAEAGGLLGSACSPVGVPSGCGSASAAYGQGTAIQKAAQTATGASLLSSVGTPALKSVLGI